MKTAFLFLCAGLAASPLHAQTPDPVTAELIKAIEKLSPEERQALARVLSGGGTQEKGAEAVRKKISEDNAGQMDLFMNAIKSSPSGDRTGLLNILEAAAGRESGPEAGGAQELPTLMKVIAGAAAGGASGLEPGQQKTLSDAVKAFSMLQTELGDMSSGAEGQDGAPDMEQVQRLMRTFVQSFGTLMGGPGSEQGADFAKAVEEMSAEYPAEGLKTLNSQIEGLLKMLSEDMKPGPAGGDQLENSPAPSSSR